MIFRDVVDKLYKLKHPTDDKCPLCTALSTLAEAKGMADDIQSDVEYQTNKVG